MERNYRRFNELFHEFGAELEKISTLYFDSIVGYSFLHEQVQLRQSQISSLLGENVCATEEFQNTCTVSYKNISGHPFFPISLRPTMKQGDVKQRTSEDGQNSLRLGELCLVSLYAYWEEYLRIEIGKAMGLLPEDAKNCDNTQKILSKHVMYDLWGDLRLFRHSILHANGVASSDFTKCKIIKWFNPGDKIELTFERVHRIFIWLAEFRNELQSLSFPPRRGIRIPSA